MASRVIILAGAPENSSLDWEADMLLDHFLEPVARFAGVYKAQQQSMETSVAEETVLDIATWRSIPLEKAMLETGFSQIHEFNNHYQGDQNFFSTAQTQGTDSASQSVLEEFYRHSLRVHDEIPSSQLPTATYPSTASSMYSTQHDSMDDTTMGDSTLLAQGDRTLGMGTAHLSDLEDVPNAKYLRSIEPQTMSVNLIVGVISIAEPRVIKTRYGTSKSLVELVVGDETRSGFSVTFWLSDEIASVADATLRALRRQDIILLRNVGLSHFKHKVHGQSLRKGLTKLDLLYRRKLDDDDIRGFYSAKELISRSNHHPQLAKTRTVRDWVLKFVGGDGVRLGKRKEKGRPVRSWELPPADTQ
ncbi:hypothetical protein BKA67DRAFT_539411 [Truncatella angustata]|uniref:Uncharacterized protein n=1 Tax=Truncatella angustata TaxID=152316 RepID=A0A9P8RP21_9PEZI|nr:uncharacterized protein BKA67DRAFT_539411 [Truncatella angustata]KAH6647553.1 hypothetical protein BKA67DRAFT_539411 [Truncatella angustata]KAH8194808.1 hypothetical protein TruAng_011019 [Truncatella angustata]